MLPSCRFHWGVDFPSHRRSRSWSRIIDQVQDFPEQFPRPIPQRTPNGLSRAAIDHDMAALGRDNRLAKATLNLDFGIIIREPGTAEYETILPGSPPCTGSSPCIEREIIVTQRRDQQDIVKYVVHVAANGAPFLPHAISENENEHHKAAADERPAGEKPHSRQRTQDDLYKG